MDVWALDFLHCHLAMSQPLCREWPREDTGRRRRSASQGERLQEEPILPTLWGRTSSSQNCERISFCCLSHTVWGTFRIPAALERGGSLEHSSRTPQGRMLFQLSVWVRPNPLMGGWDPYLHGLGCLAAPRAPPGQELLGNHAVLVGRAVLTVLKVLGGLGDPSGLAFPASPGFLQELRQELWGQPHLCHCKQHLPLPTRSRNISGL